MASTAYTENDTRAVVTRIEKDLSLVRQLVTSRDPSLRSLVLTGGFARGEGAVLDGEPQNDYDLIAIRGLKRPDVPYEKTRRELEARLGIHIDLAPVAAWRLRWVSPSIFWYETAARGRILWGEDLLGRLPARRPDELDPQEGLRLLVNRAAGLLLATQDHDPHETRIQAAKGLLAALDAHLLAAGRFAPSQTERWHVYQHMRSEGAAPPELANLDEEITWAFRFKVDPGGTAPKDASEAWRSARRAILDAVPVALRHAGLPSLDAYAKQDGLLDRIYYQLNAGQTPGARRLLANPTGHVRRATLRLLESAPDGTVPVDRANQHLASVMKHPDGPPLITLDALRRATLQ